MHGGGGAEIVEHGVWRLETWRGVDSMGKGVEGTVQSVGGGGSDMERLRGGEEVWREGHRVEHEVGAEGRVGGERWGKH